MLLKTKEREIFAKKNSRRNGIGVGKRFWLIVLTSEKTQNLPKTY